MDVLILFAAIVVDALNNDSAMFFASIQESGYVLTAGGMLLMASLLGAYGDISAGALASIRRWHGSIDAKFDNIDNVVTTLTAQQSAWSVPAEMLQLLTTNRDQLSTLIARCRSNYGSAADRTVRNSLLTVTVGMCLTQVKSWAYMQYYAGTLTQDDVHLLGFLLPGESGGHHDRKEPTDVLAEVKVSILNVDFVRVIIDQAANANAALVTHGWPTGVRMALIVIVAADGVTEVLRQQTTRLHNDIQMPKGSHGKQFIIKAAFLKHVDDVPRFGNEPTFSMPRSTEDLAAALDRQHHEDYEKLLREIEKHRAEVEQLHTELKKDK